jgi:PTH1 family peptidyl-tRNA hydrolase
LLRNYKPPGGGGGTLIVGLGNPGPKYYRTRHNAGFIAVDILAHKHDVLYQVKKEYELAEAYFYTERVHLAKPLTYMNLSGRAVKKLRKKLGLDPSRILVIHDDMDLRPGAIRIKRGGSSGGHLGLESVIRELGTGDFPRVRIGVGRPPEGMDPAEYVLAEMEDDEWGEFFSWCEEAAAAAESVVMDGLDTAMNLFNSRR